ncbi:MAG: GPR endopeptidase [Clostridia bacterium]|nr:GPR endopeptidase [Clostridia bacterium]
MYSKIRTDLAIENREFYKKAMNLDDEIPGIETIVEDSDNEFKITTVKVNTDEASNALGRPIGEYITIESQYMNDEVARIDEKIINSLSNTLKKLIPAQNTNFSVLVVGLGNSNITPDALGPKVIENLTVTRHLVKYHPELLDKPTISISAIIPGVLGTTGIDTRDIIRGISEKTSPNAIIVVDALAAKEMHRISHTIQISNTGITPGSGVKNDRNAINQESLGIPVIAVGVPTVIGIPSMVSDNFMVTPNTIDDIVTNLSRIISEGINQAFS